MLRKIRDRYQSYCATYKIHAMTTYYRGAGHTGEDRELNSHIEDTRGIDIGSLNDNECTDSLDTMVAFRESEADGHLSNPLPNSQANLSMLAREINSLLVAMSRSQRRSNSRGIGLPRTGTMESLSHAQGTTGFNPSTYRAIHRSGMPICRHSVYHTEANKSHKFTATGHCHLQ